MCAGATSASTEAVAAEDIEDDVEDGHDDLKQWESAKLAHWWEAANTYRYDHADDDHDDFSNGRDNGVDGTANSRHDSTLSARVSC